MARANHSLQTQDTNFGPFPDMAFHPLAWIAILSGWIHSIIQRIILYALRAGPIPNHVAFIMDGNRRFARKKNEPVAKGHDQGSQALRNVFVSICRVNVSPLNLDEPFRS